MAAARSERIRYFRISKPRLCSVGLQADTVDSSTCPPEGARYIDQTLPFNIRGDPR